MSIGSVYEASSPDAQLCQGEILTAVTEFSFDSEQASVTAIQHEYCVICSQECDLARDFEARQDGKPSPLNGILLYIATSATEVRQEIRARDIWKPIIQNKNERYHALEAISPDVDLRREGLPPLIIDFRRFFTISSSELAWQLFGQKAAFRRVRLISPYREHLQVRVAGYLSRVALDRDHDLPMNPEPLAISAPNP